MDRLFGLFEEPGPCFSNSRGGRGLSDTSGRFAQLLLFSWPKASEQLYPYHDTVRERKAVQALRFVYNNETQECRDGSTADRQARHDRD
jgi:hypothetical protein